MNKIKTSELPNVDQTLQVGEVPKNRTSEDNKQLSPIVSQVSWEKVKTFEALKLKFPNLDL